MSALKKTKQGDGEIVLVGVVEIRLLWVAGVQSEN